MGCDTLPQNIFRQNSGAHQINHLINIKSNSNENKDIDKNKQNKILKKTKESRPQKTHFALHVSLCNFIAYLLRHLSFPFHDHPNSCHLEMV